MSVSKGSQITVETLDLLTSLGEKKQQMFDTIIANIDILTEKKKTTTKKKSKGSSSGRARATVRGPMKAAKTIGAGNEIASFPLEGRSFPGSPSQETG